MDVDGNGNADLPTAGPLGRMRDLAAFRTFEALRVASLDWNCFSHFTFPIYFFLCAFPFPPAAFFAFSPRWPFFLSFLLLSFSPALGCCSGNAIYLLSRALNALRWLLTDAIFSATFAIFARAERFRFRWNCHWIFMACATPPLPPPPPALRPLSFHFSKLSAANISQSLFGVSPFWVCPPPALCLAIEVWS